MIHTTRNFRTKEAMKIAFRKGEEIRVHQIGLWFMDVRDGWYFIEGTRIYSESWFGRVKVKDNKVEEIIE